MNLVNYFKDLLVSITDFRKIVLLKFLVKNDCDFQQESCYLKKILIVYVWRFEKLRMQQNEEYLDYIKNEEEAIIEEVLNR